MPISNGPSVFRKQSRWGKRLVAACRGRLAAGLAAVALIWSVGSSLWVYPHSLSYFNESIGGPINGAHHLLGSCLNWGQDLKYGISWTNKNPQCRFLAYSGGFSPRDVGQELLPQASYQSVLSIHCCSLLAEDYHLQCLVDIGYTAGERISVYASDGKTEVTPIDSAERIRNRVAYSLISF